MYIVIVFVVIIVILLLCYIVIIICNLNKTMAQSLKANLINEVVAW